MFVAELPNADVPRTAAVMALLALAAILTQIPNWLAVLSPHSWKGALAVTLVLTILVTAAEPALIEMIVPDGPPFELALILAGINVFATGWVLTFAVVFRRAGYRVSLSRP
jgi:hypothetical protein